MHCAMCGVYLTSSTSKTLCAGRFCTHRPSRWPVLRNAPLAPAPIPAISTDYPCPPKFTGLVTKSTAARRSHGTWFVGAPSGSPGLQTSISLPCLPLEVSRFASLLFFLRVFYAFFFVFFSVLFHAFFCSRRSFPTAYIVICIPAICVRSCVLVCSCHFDILTF